MSDQTVSFLEPFVGEWRVEVTFPGQPPAGSGARTTFELMPGERFLIQRWTVPIPEAPDGIAIIGFAEETGKLLQHYFDTRGRGARVRDELRGRGVEALRALRPTSRR